MSDTRPFSKAYVLSTTTFHMKRSCDISINKTYERYNDATTEEHKKIEIFETLDVLHRMRKMIDDFEKANEHLFKSQR